MESLITSALEAARSPALLRLGLPVNASTRLKMLKQYLDILDIIMQGYWTCGAQLKKCTDDEDCPGHCTDKTCCRWEKRFCKTYINTKHSSVPKQNTCAGEEAATVEDTGARANMVSSRQYSEFNWNILDWHRSEELS